MQEVSEYLSEWVTLRSSGLAPRTVECYNGLIENHIRPALRGVAVDALSCESLQRFLSLIITAGHSRTAQLCFVLMRAAYRDGVRSGILSEDPTARILRPRHEPAAPRYWTPEEIKDFLSACPGFRWGHAWLLALLCGLRRGELAGLRWSDVDFEGRVLHIRNQRQRLEGVGVVDLAPKSRAGRRDIPMPPLVYDTLSREFRRQRLQQAKGAILPAYVVSGVDNRPIDPHRLNRALSVDMSSCHLRPINLHGLRHSMATAAVAAGIPIKVLQSLLGHAQYSTTADVYAHVLMGERIAAMEALQRAVCT